MKFFKKSITYGLVLCIALLVLPSIIAESSPAQPTPKIQVPIDTFPTMAEMYPWVNPNLYKPDVILPIEKSVEIATESMLGFRGPYYLAEVDGSSIDLVQESLYSDPTSEYWNIHGLIRNETLSPITTTKVQAHLFDAEGQIIKTVEADTFLNLIRPGEPAPFKITTSIPFEDVVAVEWSIEYDTGEAKYSRLLVLYVHWQIDYGDEYYRGHKRDDGPTYPYVLFTGFMNMGEKINQTEIIAAWLNEKGQVIHIASAPHDPVFSKGFNKYDTIHFEEIIIEHEDIALKLNEANYMLWGIGQ